MPERVLHVYAVTDRPAPLPQIEGIAGAPLLAVGNGALAAVCSWGEPAEASEAALWRHEAVAEALMESRTILPARFGIGFSDEARLRKELVRRQEELTSSLRRVAGCVELGLRVLHEPKDTNPDVGRAPSGRAYMQARLEGRARAAEAAVAVHEPLVRLAAATRIRTLVTDRLLLSASYLVRREAVARFRAAVEGLSAERPDLQLLCTGPWPPYSFAGFPEDGS